MTLCMHEKLAGMKLLKNKRSFFTLLVLILWNTGQAQVRYDSLIFSNDSTKRIKVMCYPYKEHTLIFQKPKHFGFITGIPKTFSHAARETFNKKSLPALSVIAVSTLLLVAVDQPIMDGFNQFSRYINLNPNREYKTIIGFRLGSMPVNVYEAPLNLNTALYSIGEGSTSVAIAAGLFIFGKVKNDYRALQTSSQLMQSLLAVGVTTQVVKRISGRESPFVATAPGGKWRPLTNPGVYQKSVPHYDAFPSGHLATMMTTLVIVSDNYPEKRWIKPVGYSLITLVGLAMVNNRVHWASDYPLALGIGYVCGKVTVKMNRWVRKIS